MPILCYRWSAGVLSGSKLVNDLYEKVEYAYLQACKHACIQCCLWVTAYAVHSFCFLFSLWNTLLMRITAWNSEVILDLMIIAMGHNIVLKSRSVTRIQRGCDACHLFLVFFAPLNGPDEILPSERICTLGLNKITIEPSSSWFVATILLRMMTKIKWRLWEKKENHNVDDNDNNCRIKWSRKKRKQQKQFNKMWNDCARGYADAIGMCSCSQNKRTK